MGQNNPITTASNPFPQTPSHCHPFVLIYLHPLTLPHYTAQQPLQGPSGPSG